jgi:corrinoid protein of di/trimethylamine methyltransferase
MTNEISIQKFIDAVISMDIEAAKNYCEDAISEGLSPYKIIQEGIIEAVSIIGDKFENEEYFLAELIMGGEIIKQTMSILKPYIQGNTSRNVGSKIVIGTAKGDLHDIGKNIVATFLNAEGFEVVDLGVDVSAEKFIKAVKNFKPKILAISALVSTTMVEVKKIMTALNDANIRDQVKIIVGGAPITQAFVDDIGADAYAKDVIDGIKICKRWTEA